jgi:hypothetical protein
MFQHLTKEQLERVAGQVEFATYGDYDWSGEYKRLAQAGGVRPEKEPVIVSEGDYPNGIVLCALASRASARNSAAANARLNYIGAGQVFGLQEIAHNWRNKTAAGEFSILAARHWLHASCSSCRRA